MIEKQIDITTLTAQRRLSRQIMKYHLDTKPFFVMGIGFKPTLHTRTRVHHQLPLINPYPVKTH